MCVAVSECSCHVVHVRTSGRGQEVTLRCRFPAEGPCVGHSCTECDFQSKLHHVLLLLCFKESLELLACASLIGENGLWGGYTLRLARRGLWFPGPPLSCGLGGGPLCSWHLGKAVFSRNGAVLLPHFGWRGNRRDGAGQCHTYQNPRTQGHCCSSSATCPQWRIGLLVTILPLCHLNGLLGDSLNRQCPGLCCPSCRQCRPRAPCSRKASHPLPGARCSVSVSVTAAVGP